MPQFVLIDNSIEDLRGHHYSYAVQVLQAASAAGYLPVLATGKQFSGSLPEGWALHRGYEYGSWIRFRPPLLRPLKLLGRRLRARFTAPETWSPELGDGASHQQAVLSRPAYRWLRRSLRERYNAVRRRSFAASTSELFARFGLRDGDVVFVPNASHVELQGLADFFELNPEAAAATWHLLFRRDVPEQAPDRGDSLSELTGALVRYGGTRGGAVTSYYTDTDVLSCEHGKLGLAPFETLPIPQSVDWFPVTRALQEPLCLSYLGDPRTERGYHWLPWLIDSLWADYVEPGRIRFQVQTQVDNPDVEAETFDVWRHLRRYPPDKVRLLEGPLLPADYQARLQESDILLLLHDRAAYTGRSSGVFVEALAAGKPVVVPDGSWMASELRSLQRASCGNVGPGLTYQNVTEVPGLLRLMIDHYVDFQAASEQVAAPWRQRHNASRLVAVLLDGTKNKRSVVAS